MQGPIRRLVLGRLARRFTDLGRRERLHARAERRRALRGKPRVVHYFHQVDDPGSALVAQVLESFAGAYAIELVPHLVSAPSPSMIAARHPDAQRAWVRKDAADIAPGFGLRFVDPGREPDPEAVSRGRRILAARSPSDFVALVAAVSDAVWREDEVALAGLERRAPPATEGDTRARLRRDDRLLRRLGYVYGGTFHYGGEWFLGVDRMEYLEARLVAQGAARRPAETRVVPRPRERGDALDASGTRVEFFPSIRSPYSYVAMQRVTDLVRRTRVELVPRPVLPILMRGGYSGAFGQMVYVYADSAREAETHGVGPFDIWECVGRPVERAYSLFPWARDRGRGLAYLHAYTRGVFAERIDAGREPGLRSIVERAGLPWSEARERIDRPGWREEIDSNLRDLYGMGLWGVPSFRVSGGGREPFHTWGADRIWLVEDEIRRRAVARGSAALGSGRP